MCGIAGIVDLAGRGPAPDRAGLTRMLGALHHRGPDETGLYRDRVVGLAHTRLSIIDLATGQQPLCNADGTLWIAFNGEIFNYVELREELVARGHVFHTRSDTEVIVHAWEAWGEAAFDRFNGQWAIALWDPARRRLVLSRDRVGIRPLYYAEAGGRLAFGSEVKAIFAGVPELPRRFDAAGLDETFTFWTVVPPRTVFEGVREVEPGHVRVYDGVGTAAWSVADHAYWQPSYPGDFTGSLAEATEAVAHALERATALRMLRADVDVGSYLSGGLDSSIIAAHSLAAKGPGFQTFSLRFEDAEYDEGEFQRAMSAHLGTRHHEIVVSRADIARAFPETCRLAERPILRTAPAPMYLLSRLVHDHGIKVVLTGEGADEMFAGYDLFREAAVRRFWARAPGSQLRPRLLDKLYPYLARSPVTQRRMAQAFFGRGLERWREPGFGHDTRWHTTAAIKRLLAAPVRAARGADQAVTELLATLPPELVGWSYLAQDQYLEIRTLMSGYLLSAQGDRMLMGNSVEGRFPFLDRDVMALAGSLPDSYKLRGLDEKHVLKRLGERLVPEAIRRRPKQPYRAPDALAFVGTDRPGWVDDLMSAEVTAAAGVFEPGAVAKLWAKCTSRADSQFSNTDNMAVVAVLSSHWVWRSLIDGLDVRPPPSEIRTVVEREVAGSA
ncbi:MAG: asparagine synthase (glutamine-hydrolyzing) [Kofleriaceae bacterium]|nr:asparagine synthase (glutamine-hydrolyzing) [Myxococcales bacterium]MCB9565059.1 asparagine synthase (glutamine-hydrolyzing) [Kofleriaceae bacterium]MCB9574063.1 asparagine synthase (glutamine-hydrolyzing) [Kofleriaceae bacterium]